MGRRGGRGGRGEVGEICGSTIVSLLCVRQVSGLEWRKYVPSTSEETDETADVAPPKRFLNMSAIVLARHSGIGSAGNKTCKAHTSENAKVRSACGSKRAGRMVGLTSLHLMQNEVRGSMLRFNPFK